MALLEVNDLRVTLPTPRGPADALRGVSFALERGETVGLIGESGCGKSMTALALMGLLPDAARARGSVRFDGTELLGLDDSAMGRLRGRRIGMVFQEPMTALNPLHTIGRQVADQVEARGMALLLVSHDLGVMARTVDRLLVMYGGSVVEAGPTAAVFEHLAHPYTRGLFGARPRLGAARGTRLATIPGRVPELIDLPPGCPFADRCGWAVAACRAAPPPPVEVEPGHTARCIRLDAIAAGEPPHPVGPAVAQPA